MQENPKLTEDQEPQSKLKTLEGATVKHTRQFIVRRWKNLQEVRHRMSSWLILLAVLIVAAVWQGFNVRNLSMVQAPSEGATYTEGVFGAVDNVNPIFASTPAERSISRLVFASLLRYDDKGDLVGDLAQHWSADDEAKAYTVTLKPDARWHDGVPITSKDVVFTFDAVKDASTKSPLYSSWRNISVSAVDDKNVKFVLPTSYSPFLNALTVGILPEHILGKVKHSELRNNAYNREPTVGSGPFIFQDIRALDNKRQHFLIRLTANDNYFFSKPKLSRFHMHAYVDRDQLQSGFVSQEVSAVSDLSTAQLQGLKDKADINYFESPLYEAVYAFLKTDNPDLSDVKVRTALAMATDRGKIIEKLDNRFEPVDGPLLKGHLGYRNELKLPDVNMSRAGQLLDEAGWRLNKNGKRVKDGKEMKLQVVTLNSGDYPVVAQELTSQWTKLGIGFETQLVKVDDIQQGTLVPRAYDVLIYDVVLGGDADIYAYWHSSQVNERGFNLSNYKSSKVDDALDSARSQSNIPLRDAKYVSFIKQWLNDVPAVGLYRPSLSYLQAKNVTSFAPRMLSDPTDRYYNARLWSSNKDFVNATR